MEFYRTRKVRLHLSIAPLIDVVLLLVIFFVLSSNFSVQHGLKITLPKADTAFPQTEALVIAITQDNTVYLDQQIVPLDTLLVQLRQQIQVKQPKHVTIQADEKIDLGLAIKVMDIAQQAQAPGIVIATKSATSHVS